MKLVCPLLALLLLAACSAQSPPFHPGDTLVAASDGSVLGKVVEVGNHAFANGFSGPAIHVALPSGRDAWYSMDTTVSNYVVKK